ncbi:hypothetical protein Poly51_38020 [Rubripirellula tenax]|uniref:Membrane protein (DUF2306) n=1 Tax=Rubripirellula tenax TaxID=2528015 RepID=A0A5C6EMZ3_9BACT|nr:DUF2306 domain-containing protein [Rubripirellula tenax]TWU50512.1 hypothetical protein Poly51_38020 [Rubripirellula tenax]
MSATHTTARRSWLHRAILFAATLLLTRVWALTIWEYRNYIPPNFDSAFLCGMRDTFFGWYSIAFYAHIVAGPIVLLLAAFLMFTGGRGPLASMHRRVAKLHIAIVVTVVAPTGFLMAIRAHAGPIAGVGFASLAIATAMTAVRAMQTAKQRSWVSHRKWATRCFLLLLSPLLLRLVSGLASVLDAESETFYRINAWVSWLAPWLIYELVLYIRSPSLRPLPKGSRHEQVSNSQTSVVPARLHPG